MKRLALCLAFLFWASAAFAQMSGVRTVTSCGNPSPYPALNIGISLPAWLTVDANMNLCTSGGGGGGSSAFTVPHASSVGTVSALAVKTSSGFLLGFNCTGITGAAAGFCVAYNSATTPSAGALTAAAVLDYCFFDTTARGCSLGRAPSQVAYSAGIQILVTTATSPYTYTTGAAAAVSADFQ